jgi:hypothetical protein
MNPFGLCRLPRRLLRAASLVATLLPASCVAVDGRDSGDRCAATDECSIDLECVVVDGGQGFCLPRPAVRAPRSCSDDAACRLSDGQLWPVESECLDAQCRCLTAEVSCVEDDEDDFTVVLQEETCRCLQRGAVGDACLTAHTCEPGLACSAGECRDAAGGVGAACMASIECNTGRCGDFRGISGVGVCLSSSLDGACVVDDDCDADLVCRSVVSGGSQYRCLPAGLGAGEACAADNDCSSEQCSFDGFCL